MPLIIRLKLGEEFYVEGAPVKCQDIYSPSHFTLLTKDGIIHHIVEDRATEIMPEVFVSVGSRSGTLSARALVRAPKEIKILRSETHGYNGFSP